MPQELPEERRLRESQERTANWKRWGPYLAERQWGTVREDYSPDGTVWTYFPHDHARSRAYRWGEDGLLGITDRECRLCFALALWNERDPILKERIFGLGGPEGNHGEDAKECWFYLDSTPTHSYFKALYKYPQAEFPYRLLREENRRRGLKEPELELEDTGVFDGGRYFDVEVEYAKRSPNDLLIRVRIANRSPEAAPIHVLPTLWFRNTWSWGSPDESGTDRPVIARAGARLLRAEHSTLGAFRLEASEEAGEPAILITENETNTLRLFNYPCDPSAVKDAIGEYVIRGEAPDVVRRERGTKAAFHYRFEIAAGSERRIDLRLSSEDEAHETSFGEGFEEILSLRRREADDFYAARIPPAATAEERLIMRRAYAGLLWSKQFYHYAVKRWLEGDPAQPPPPPRRLQGRNRDWRHLYNRDVISMPDKWEYPWYAAWDLAFHMLPFARIDPDFAKEQLILFLREWYMHPNGQIPAYEFALDDVNPPVHAWAAWRVYKMSAPRGKRDTLFLKRVYKKLLLNFTWWVNRKDLEGNHLFAGGFLGLDNVGLFDRSKPLPGGGRLEQADGTAWMAFYCGTMLSMALELAVEEPSYEDIASKFFEHFVAIADAMNTLGGTGLWDERDGFYYDQLRAGGKSIPLRVRSMVGLIPLFAVEILEADRIARLPGFRKRMEWFLRHRADLARHIAYCERDRPEGEPHAHCILAIPSRERLVRVLRYLLDEEEFLSPYGVRSLSKVHAREPFVLHFDGEEYRVGYEPGEAETALFGGNSNWRGPVWFPLNFLLIEALERYHHFYGDALRVECPVGSGRLLNLGEVACELARRLANLFLDHGEGRPCDGGDPRFRDDPHWKGLLRFHEYFHGETGKGLGASHQTGWTALVTLLLEDRARRRAQRARTS